MKRLIIATGNEDKMREIREILKDTEFVPVSMKEAGLYLAIEENGDSFEENALIKARAVAEAAGEMALADDSGLEIDALGGAPGIFSARYLGEDTSYSVKNQKILEQLEQVPEEERSARFVCAAACVFPDGRELVCRETMEGRIAVRAAGENGFGYDPIFYLPRQGCTSAQLTSGQKNEISHRGKAFRCMRDKLCGLVYAG